MANLKFNMKATLLQTYHIWNIQNRNNLTVAAYAIINPMTQDEYPATESLTDVTPEGAPPSGAGKKLWWIISIAVILIGLIITGIIFLSRAGSDATSQVRDIFIILMALVSIVIGAALVVLIIQIASLINLLQNEIKPILKTTTDTVNTLKGTTTFLSDNLANPVIKLNSQIAGMRKLLDLISIFKK